MTKKKEIATTLRNVLEHPTMVGILDRQSDILPLIEQVDNFWTYDLFSRKPSPAEHDDEGNLIKATNLDLSTFLYALWDRGAMINLPKYTSWRPKTVNEGQMVLSQNNRHGKITGLTSHQEIFSFGVRILDQNVVSTDQSGFPRAFSITDANGDWYDGWKTIDFMPSASENKWLAENKIWTNNKIVFDNFVNPNRWICFFGQYYFMTKAMISRLADEKKHLDAIKKRMLANGIQLPDDMKSDFTKYDSSSTKGDSVSIRIESIEVQVDVPDYETVFVEYEDSVENLIYVWDRLKKIRAAQEKFSYSVRCIEYAIYSQNRFDAFPVWIKNVKWEEDFKDSPRARTLWRRLKIQQPAAFERSIAIRYRVRETSQDVSPEYANSLKASGPRAILV